MKLSAFQWNFDLISNQFVSCWHTLVKGFSSALLKQKSRGSLCCVCTCGWHWPEPYGDQICHRSDMGVAIYLWAHRSPPFQIQRKLLWECLCCLYNDALVCWQQTHLCLRWDRQLPSSLLPPLQQFVFRPDPLHQTEPLSSKRWFPPAISSLFKTIQQRFRFRCPISYFSLTIHRQWEQVLLTVPE